MIELTHTTFVAIAKSYGLFYLILLFVIAVAYVYWPSNKKRFERAARSIFHDEEA